MRFAYPILLDVSGRRCVIVGGGGVAVRKAQGLLAAGATDVHVVAPRIAEAMPPTVQRVIESYDEHHLDGSGLVFAATDDAEVNGRVVADATRRGIAVSRADEDEVLPGDFVVPAVHREGAVTIAVSAGSAALAAAIRDEVARSLDARWARLSEAMRVLRPRIKRIASLSSQQRSAILRDLASPGARDAAGAGTDAVWAWLLGRHSDLSG